MIQKTASDKIIDLNLEEKVSAIIIIDLNIEVFAEKTMVALIFEIDDSGIHTAMTLMNQDIIMLYQIVMLGFEIQYL